MDVFHTLAEIAVAVTGFSSLIVIFRGTTATWDPQEYISFAFVFFWSIGALFLSLLPIVLTEFDLDVERVARIGLFSAVGFMVLVGTGLTMLRMRAGSAAGDRPFNVWMHLSFLFVVAVASVGAWRWLPGPAAAWYAATIVLLLVHATAELALFVYQSVRR